MYGSSGVAAAPLKHLAWLLLALANFFAGGVLAWHHPLWPAAAVLLFGAWCLLAAWHPGLWLFVVPASLPVLNFSPWTGWLVFEEFDLLLLGALAGGYGRLSCSSHAGEGARIPARLQVLAVLLGGFGLLSLYRGFADAGGYSFDWFAGYADALNSWRLFKSLGFALLFLPLLQQEVRASRLLASRRLAAGMVAGQAVVTLAILWERAAFPGLLDFATPYRTVALFWEMHVGGAAIDAYLALTAPFVAWAVLAARRPIPWMAAAVLAMLSAYACLTTFSRGVYLAVAASLVLLVVLRRTQQSDFNVRTFFHTLGRRHRPEGWRTRAGLLLLLALVAEVAAVMTAGSFMTSRLARTERDLGSRIAHWRHGLALLEGPSDWLLGKGLGRLPKNYATQVPQGKFSGDANRHDVQLPGSRTNAFVAVQGPGLLGKWGALYALTQRVSLSWRSGYRVRLEVRVQNKTAIYLALCERHLLYDGNCQTAFIHVTPVSGTWQTLAVSLQGPALTGGPWYAPRLGLFTLSVINANGVADIDNVSLTGPIPKELLENGHFVQGLAHWFPVAQRYFLPWHIDNLFLEVLIERGVVGLLLFLVLMMYALWHLMAGRVRSEALSPYLAAALFGVLAVGLVSSVMDVPRVAFLLHLLTVFSLQAPQK